MGWVPLHLYSQYSVLESTSSIEALVTKAQEYSFSHLALTDRGNLYGAVDFAKACKAAKIKPIIGCELFVAPQSRFDKKKIIGQPHGFAIVLLAKNEQGYKNLCALSSQAHIEGFYWTPRIDKELLSQHKEGLICLAGSLESSLAHYVLQGNKEQLEAEVAWFQEVFGRDYYFEIMRHQMSQERLEQEGVTQEGWLYQQYLQQMSAQTKLNEALVRLSQEKKIPLVAVNASRYINPSGWKAQEVLKNIQSGEPVEIWEKDSQGNLKTKILNPKRAVFPSHELYFKSKKEMETLFSDLPEALEQAGKIAKECEFVFDFTKKYYPLFVPPYLQGTPFTKEEREKEAEFFLRKLCEEGIAKRYTPERLAKVASKYPGQDPLQVIKDRLSYELSVILPKGMGDYLLIVWDFIHWAKKNGIPMGPGRGSGAGSIILYLIEITDIEPLGFHLFFERFINPERISYPDIDVDICMDRRDEVIAYTVGKYGKDRVAQIITFGTMKAKMAIKDVGRMLNIPLARVNEIAKLIPEELNMTIKEALKIDPELRNLYEKDVEITTLIDLAQELEGSIRNTGIHAAGMIISADPIVERCPICHAKDSEMAVTQYSMKPVEMVGMLKIDFLGLKTLTSIQHAVKLIEKSRGKTIDWVNLPLDDQPTYDLLNQGKTTGIFQLESTGMQELAKQLHIDTFEELIAVVSLYRPGPMEMIPSFIARKHGKEMIEIEHPCMQEILAETYGIMVYQEQVMAIARVLAGYTLGEGDVLRRDIGKKDREEMARQREKFRSGAIQNGIDEELAMRVFDKIEKFASYGFNKSHAAAYGYLSYVTSYLKANYTQEWLAALMTSDQDDLTKVAKHMHEAKQFHIEILPPDINESGSEFVATSRGIRFAMGAIKGIGSNVVEAIVQEREKGGVFLSLYNFIQRIDTSKVGKKSIEYLIESGCFDFIGWDRQELLAYVEPIYQEVMQEQKEAAKGVLSLFSLLEQNKGERFASPPRGVPKLSKQEVMKREFALLGIYLHGHPLDEFRSRLPALSCVPLGDIEKLPASCVFRTAFLIEGVVIKISNKSQRKFAIVTIGDGIEHFELPIWSDIYEQKGHLIQENQLIYAVLQKEMQEGETKLQCRFLSDLTQVDEKNMQEYDNAYELTKMQAKRMEARGKKESSMPSVKNQDKPVRYVITLNADIARLSDIISLKQIFSAHKGNAEVELVWTSSNVPKHSLHISSHWGLGPLSHELKEKFYSISSVKKIETV